MNDSYLFTGRANLLTVIQYINPNSSLLDFATKSIDELYTTLTNKYSLDIHELFRNFIYQENYIILVTISNDNVKLYPLFQEINGNCDTFRIVPKTLLDYYDNKIHINDHQIIIPLINPTQHMIDSYIKPINKQNALIKKSLDNIQNIPLMLNSDDFNIIITQISKINLSKPFVTDNYYKYWSTRIYKFMDDSTNNKDNEYSIDSSKCINYIDSSVTIPTQYKASYTMPNNFIDDETIKKIIGLFGNNNCSTKQLVHLYCIMSVSKEFCHLTINNANIINTIFRKILRYNKQYKSIIYTCLWYNMYYMNKEENIYYSNTNAKLKYYSFTNFDKRFILTLSNVQYFRLDKTDGIYYDTNPFGVIGINTRASNLDHIRYSFRNFTLNNHKHIGLYNNIKFKKRFNLFTYRLLDNISWDNTYICGSIIPACAIKSPLEELCNLKSEAQNVQSYFKLFYDNSDVDIMIYASKDEFSKKVKLMYYKIKDNYLQYNINSFVRIAVDNTIEKIKQKMAIGFYDCHFKSNQSCLSKHIIIKILSYNCHILPSDMSKINKQLSQYIQTLNELKKEKDSKVLDAYIKYFPKYNDTSTHIIDIFFQTLHTQLILGIYTDNIIKLKQVSIKNYNTKYHIIVPGLRTFEVFRIFYRDPFYVVSRHHLPCVRALYHAGELYMLPSFLSACMTRMNIDYKYFTSKRGKSPMDIIHKYYHRGIGTFCTKKEKSVNKQYRLQKGLPNTFTDMKLIDSFYSHTFLTKKSITDTIPYVKRYIVSHPNVHPKFENCNISIKPKELSQEFNLDTYIKKYKNMNLHYVKQLLMNKNTFSSSLFFDKFQNLYNFDKNSVMSYFLLDSH